MLKKKKKTCSELYQLFYKWINKANFDLFFICFKQTERCKRTHYMTLTLLDVMHHVL